MWYNFLQIRFFYLSLQSQRCYGRAVRHRSAKPATAVRFRLAPQKYALDACLGHIHIKLCRICAGKMSPCPLCRHIFKALSPTFSNGGRQICFVKTAGLRSERVTPFSSVFCFIFLRVKRKKIPKTEISGLTSLISLVYLVQGLN